MKQIYALGVGHNTPVMIDLAMACGYEVTGLYHFDSSRTGESDHGFQILGSFEDLFNHPLEGKCFLLTMGDNSIREELIKKISDRGGEVPTLIHPSAIISNFATIDSCGVYISPFTYVQADSIIERGTILLSHVNISHTTHIGKCCFIAGGTHVGAYTKVSDYVFLGQGVLSISGKVKSIGENAYIGAGSLITKNVPAGARMVGRPLHDIE